MGINNNPFSERRFDTAIHNAWLTYGDHGASELKQVKETFEINLTNLTQQHQGAEFQETCSVLLKLKW